MVERVIRGQSQQRAEPNWHGVELRHLIALQAVAAERSFSAAAARLGYTQPAVSGQILSLERLIGARLFVRMRGTRPLELTDEGSVLLQHAAAITARLDAAQADVAAVRAFGSAALHVGTFATVSPTLVAAVLRLLLPAQRGGQIVLRESSDSPALLELVERGKLDLTFATLPLPEGPFEATAVYRDPYVLLVRRTDPLAARTTVSLEELTSLPVLTLERSSAQAAVEAAISAGGRPLEVARRFENVASILAFVEAGLGPALVPSLAAEPPADLVALELDARVPARVVALAWHRDRTLGPLAETFVETAAAAARTLQGARGSLRAAS
jgi:DNA-binding transcriptional LysR family regulator